jgi:hypothetical protein
MLSLFCVTVCVVAQPTLSNMYAAAILRKIHLISFIGRNRIVDKVPLFQKVIPVVICGPCMTVPKRKPFTRALSERPM